MPINEHAAIQLAPKKLTPVHVNKAAGGEVTIVSAPGAGKRIRLYRCEITQDGTAAGKMSLRWGTGATDFYLQSVGKAGAPVVFGDGRNYVEGPDNTALLGNVEDQAADDADFNALYTIEEN